MQRVAQELNLSPDVFTIRYLDVRVLEARSCGGGDGGVVGRNANPLFCVDQPLDDNGLTHPPTPSSIHHNHHPPTNPTAPPQLSVFDSVRKFAKEVKAIKGGKPLDALVCNAAVYLPAKSYPTFTPDGIEESLQINHLSHFLLVSLLLDDLKKAKDPRCIIVGSITVRARMVVVYVLLCVCPTFTQPCT